MIRKFEGSMSEKERSLWGKHLELRDAITVAEYQGQVRTVRKLEAEFKGVKDLLFARYRKPRRVPSVEPFRYSIPIVDAETGKKTGELIATEKGVLRPDAVETPLPENRGRREWLKPIPISRYAKQKAMLTWKALGHEGRPQCPGCRGRGDLTYLEFRNWADGSGWKIPHVLAVCGQTAKKLLKRSKSTVFGVTALKNRIPWPCANRQAPVLPMQGPSQGWAPSSSDSRRGKHHNPRSLANLIPKGRSRSENQPHSFRRKPA